MPSRPGDWLQGSRFNPRPARGPGRRRASPSHRSRSTALKPSWISTEPYWFDGGADLSPVDYAVGWGPMSDRAILGKLSVSQGGRWFRYRSRGEWPLPMEEISPHCANMHMIPADSRIERQLKSVHPADIVNLSGYLVEVHGPRGMKWRSSLTRTDTGAGSCELMWVEEVSKRRN